MQDAIISPKGVLAARSSFIDVAGERPPTTISFEPGADSQEVTPDITTFSSFGSAKSARGFALCGSHNDCEKGYRAGDHVALCYNSSKSFFSIAILRCDTWAIQWAVATTDDYRVEEVLLLSAHLIVGVAIFKMQNRKKIFVASRLDSARVGKRENREWRHFMATPRLLDADAVPAGVISIVASSCNSFVLLTEDGSLHSVHLSMAALIDRHAPLVVCTTLRKNVVKAMSSTTRMLYLSSEDVAYIVVFSPNGQQCDIICCQGSTVSRKSLKITEKLLRIESVGSNDLVLTLGTEKATSIQFVSLIPGSKPDTFDFVQLEPIALKCNLVGCFYNSVNDAHTLIALTSSSEDNEEGLLHSLSQATFSFSNGPYDANQVSSAHWSPIYDPFRHYGPRMGHDGDDMSGLYKDIAMFEGNHGNGGGGFWVPLKLFYTLAIINNRSQNSCEVAIFSVKTAPYIHTRLIKQWHNATNGLKYLLTSESLAQLEKILLLPWNPRHMRRALRLLTQSQLGSIFASVANTLRTSANDASYCHATTAACDMALHIITLSRQMGVTLEPEDVGTVATILRASRELGHDCLRNTSRMSLLMNSCFQQRVARRLLSQTAPHPTNANEEDDATQPSLLEVYYGIPDEIRAGRTLQTRYTANTWAQQLSESEEKHKKTIAAANRYLSAGSFDAPEKVCDWPIVGVQPHADDFFSQYESTLVTYQQQ